MQLLTIKSYPIIISQSEISAAKNFPEGTIRFDKSGRFNRSCSQNYMPLVASWVPPPIIWPLATFKRTGLRLGFRNSS